MNMHANSERTRKKSAVQKCVQEEEADCFFPLQDFFCESEKIRHCNMRGQTFVASDVLCSLHRCRYIIPSQQKRRYCPSNFSRDFGDINESFMLNVPTI